MFRPAANGRREGKRSRAFHVAAALALLGAFPDVEEQIGSELADDHLNLAFAAGENERLAMSILREKLLAGEVTAKEAARIAKDSGVTMAIHTDKHQILSGKPTVIVQNGDPYTYFHGKPVEIARGATLDSGSLAGVVLRGTNPVMIPTLAARLLTGRWEVADHKHVEPFAATDDFTITSTDDRPVAIHVDGDHIDDVTEARYGVRPHALSIIA